MINREDFNGKKYEEMVPVMQEKLNEYKTMVDAFETINQCTAEEQVLMASMDEVDNRLNTVTYTLPDSIDFGGKHYSRKDIIASVVYFLNKIEVKWEHTLGMYQLVALWKGDNFTEIPYRAYDSTLRCLNQVTFKGMQEWTDILAVNEYLSVAHNEYSLDTGILIFYSECHNILMNRMKELNPQDTAVPDSLEE
jgi:hypothetical protein